MYSSLSEKKLAFKKFIKFILFDLSLKLAPFFAIFICKNVIGIHAISQFIFGTVAASFLVTFFNMSLGDRHSNPNFLTTTKYKVLYFVIAIVTSDLAMFFGSLLFAKGFFATLIMNNPYGLLNTLSLKKKYVWLYLGFKSLLFNVLPIFGIVLYLFSIAVIYVADIFLYKRTNKTKTIENSVISELISGASFSIPLVLASAVELLYSVSLNDPHLLFYSNIILRITKSLQQSLINFNVFGFGQSALKTEALIIIITIFIIGLTTQYLEGFTLSISLIFIITNVLILSSYFIYSQSIKKRLRAC
jgi:hypothetical protein